MENRIYDLLKGVIDPEVNLNIIDLGLVYDINVSESNIIITMTLSAKGCPLGDTIMEAVEYSVKNEYPSFNVNVNLVWEPEWNPSLISNEGKKQLGL